MSLVYISPNYSPHPGDLFLMILGGGGELNTKMPFLFVLIFFTQIFIDYSLTYTPHYIFQVLNNPET